VGAQPELIYVPARSARRDHKPHARISVREGPVEMAQVCPRLRSGDSQWDHATKAAWAWPVSRRDIPCSWSQGINAKPMTAVGGRLRRASRFRTAHQGWQSLLRGSSRRPRGCFASPDMKALDGSQRRVGREGGELAPGRDANTPDFRPFVSFLLRTIPRRARFFLH